MLNVKLLEEVRQKILKNPRSFDMGYYKEEPLAYDYDVIKYDLCNTVGCICGWSIDIVKKRWKKSFNSLDLDGYGDENGASKLLGITRREAAYLFHVENWPEDFKKAYRSSKTALQRAKVASHLIKTVIKKGKVWWVPELSYSYF